MSWAGAVIVRRVVEEVGTTVTDPPTDELTRRIDAAISDVYRTGSRQAMDRLGSYGVAAVDRVLELYRGSTTGPQEHARLLNALGNDADEMEAAARRAVARACPRRYMDRLHGRLEATEITVVEWIQDPRVTPMLLGRLSDPDSRVRYRAAAALIGRVEGHGNDDRRTREVAEQAVLDRLDDDALAVRAVAAYAVARRSRADGIVAYQQILRPTEPETLMFADVQLRIAALRRGEPVPPLA